MKKLLRTLMLIFSVITLSSQGMNSIQNPMNPNETFQQDTGLLFTYASWDRSGTYLMKEQIYGNAQKMTNRPAVRIQSELKYPKQICHVVIQFDQQPMSGMVQMCSNQNSYSKLILFQPMITLDIEAGIYEILTHGSFLNSVFRYVSLSKVIVTNDTTIQVNFSDANHVVSIEAMDKDNQVMLFGNEGIIKEQLSMVIGFPTGNNTMFSMLSLNNFSSGNVWFSHFDTAYKIQFSVVSAKDGELYAIDMGELTGVDADTTLTSTPAEYVKFASCFEQSPVSKENYLVFEPGIIYTAKDNLSHYTSLSMSGGTDYPVGDKNHLDVYLSNVLYPSRLTTSTIALNYWEENPFEYPGGRPPLLTQTQPAYLTLDKKIAFCPYNNPLTEDYVAPSESIILYGGLSPLIEAENYNNSSDSTIFFIPKFSGQINETRQVDYYSTTYEIKRGNEVLISDSVFKFGEPYHISEYGDYTINLHHNDYFLNELIGDVQLQMHVNMGLADANSPVVTSLKIMNENERIDSIFYSDDKIYVDFSAGDWNYYDSLFSRVAYAKLFYKIHTSNDWIEQPLQEFPSVFNSSKYGSFFEGDLSSLATSFTCLTPVDLKIEMADSSGNSTSQIISPAFLVDGSVGINETRISNNDLWINVYPNPIKEKSTILFRISKNSRVNISICDINGQTIQTVVDCDLVKGEYAYEFHDSQSLTKNVGKMYLLVLKSDNKRIVRKIFL